MAKPIPDLLRLVQLVDDLAEVIWLAEAKRAGPRGKRLVPWSEVNENDQARYRFIADEVVTFLIAEAK